MAGVDALTYRLADGSAATLDPAAYIVDKKARRPRVLLADDADWPAEDLEPGSSVALQFRAGFAAPVTFDVPTNTVTVRGRTVDTGDVVYFSNSGGALPTGIVEGGLYLRSEFYGPLSS